MRSSHSQTSAHDSSRSRRPLINLNHASHQPQKLLTGSSRTTQQHTKTSIALVSPMEYPVRQAWASPWGCELGQEQMNQHDYDQNHFEPPDSICEALYYNADLADLGFDPATAVDDFYNDCDFGLGLESETQFGLSLDQFANSRTASSEDYVALAYMFNPPIHYVNPEDLNQSAMASDSPQLLGAGYPTASHSTVTSSSPALTHSQLLDAASEHEQTPGSDFASQASPAVSQGPYPCAQCNKSFSKRYDLT